MRIAFIGGVSDKKVYEPELYGNEHVKDFITATERSSGFQTSVKEPQKSHYVKMILKRNGELKYFFVPVGVRKDDLLLLDEYWDLSDTIGYDLD